MRCHGGGEGSEGVRVLRVVAECGWVGGRGRTGRADDVTAVGDGGAGGAAEVEELGARLNIDVVEACRTCERRGLLAAWGPGVGSKSEGEERKRASRASKDAGGDLGAERVPHAVLDLVPVTLLWRAECAEASGRQPQHRRSGWPGQADATGGPGHPASSKSMQKVHRCPPLSPRVPG